MLNVHYHAQMHCRLSTLSKWDCFTKPYVHRNAFFLQESLIGLPSQVWDIWANGGVPTEEMKDRDGHDTILEIR